MGIPVGQYHDEGHSSDFESPKTRRSPRLATSNAPIGASRTEDTSLGIARSPFSHTIVAPKSASSSTVFEPVSPFTPTVTSTAAAPPRRKREKYHCKYCLDSFPTQEQRNMHEINKHNAWLMHPGFLAPKLPDTMFFHDW